MVPKTAIARRSGEAWRWWYLWAGKDSNLRRLCRQIYSLLPLAARAPTQIAEQHATALPPTGQPAIQMDLIG